MTGYRQITRAEFYRLLDRGDPRAIKMMRGKSWVYYLRTN